MNKILTLAFAISFSSVVSAEGTAPAEMVEATQTSFQSIDTNLDGVISMSEIADKETLQLAFAELDLDNNGELNEAEYNKFKEEIK